MLRIIFQYLKKWKTNLTYLFRFSKNDLHISSIITLQDFFQCFYSLSYIFFVWMLYIYPIYRTFTKIILSSWLFLQIWQLFTFQILFKDNLVICSQDWKYSANITRKATGFKSVQLNWWNKTQVILISKMSTSFSRTLTS